MNLREIQDAANEPFKFAVFSGGGAKGAIYSGVQEAMAKSGVLAGLVAVAGSSAGAITAAAIATGITEADFIDLSQNTDFQALLGGRLINNDAEPLYRVLQNMISKNILGYLDEQETNIFNICNLRNKAIEDKLQLLNEQISQDPTNPELKESIGDLARQKTIIKSILDRQDDQIAQLRDKAKQNKPITFKDLDLLHVLDPIRFKGLVITATNNETGKLTIFDANSPDVEIAKACKASAAIPLYLTPVEIDGVEYVDGGYRDNVPLKYFGKNNSSQEDFKDISDSQKEISQAKKEKRILTLVFGYDNMEDQANIAVYSSRSKIINNNFIINFLVNVVFKILNRVGGDFVYTDEEQKTSKRVRENSLNTVILDTQTVGTLSFNEAKKRSAYLHIKGYIQTNRYFANHQIGTNQDSNLEIKEFMLSVYEKSYDRMNSEKWKNAIIGGQEAKLSELLSCCKDSSWSNKTPEQMIKDFILVSSTSRTNNLLTTNTSTTHEIVATLNDPKTPNDVRLDFIRVLQVDIGDTNKLVDFKFKLSDFDRILKEAQNNLTVNPKANDTQKAESPPKSAKDAILEKGSEGKGMREKINDEKNSEEPKNLAK